MYVSVELYPWWKLSVLSGGQHSNAVLQVVDHLAHILSVLGAVFNRGQLKKRINGGAMIIFYNIGSITE